MGFITSETPNTNNLFSFLLSLFPLLRLLRLLRCYGCMLVVAGSFVFWQLKSWVKIL